MPEWWTYSLSDFLMFSPQVYWRLVARFNATWWPGQAIALAAALALPLLLGRSVRPARVALLLLAPAWAWVGWAWHWQRYGEIFLAAAWLAGACAMQAALLLIAVGAPTRDERGSTLPGPLAWVLLIAGVLYPLLAPLTGHAWSDAEVFGFMPEPTALATLAVVASLRPWHTGLRVALAVLPVLSLLLGGATRWLIAQ